MFEGKLPVAQDSRFSVLGNKPEEKLCELSWSELVAKLKAARDLRAELSSGGEDTLASFDAGSARHLASHHDILRQDNNKHGVNPSDLGNGKGAGCIALERIDRETTAIRGTT